MKHPKQAYVIFGINLQTNGLFGGAESRTEKTMNKATIIFSGA